MLSVFVTFPAVFTSLERSQELSETNATSAPLKVKVYCSVSLVLTRKIIARIPVLPQRYLALGSGDETGAPRMYAMIALDVVCNPSLVVSWRGACLLQGLKFESSQSVGAVPLTRQFR